MAKSNIEVEIKVPKDNKVFACKHDGHYLSGYSVVVAISKREALELLTEALVGHGLKTDPAELKLTEIDLTHSRAIVLWDGNY